MNKTAEAAGLAWGVFFRFFGRHRRGRPRFDNLLSRATNIFHVSTQAPKRPLSEILTAPPFTSQSKCQFSRPIQVALVRLTPYHISHMLIETLRRRGQSQNRHFPLLWYDDLDVKQYGRLMVLQSRLERVKSRYGSTTTKWPQSKTISEETSGATWRIRYSFLYV